MTELPEHVYDDAVRALLRCPATHTHISIGHLRAMVEDPAAFRAALTVAFEAGQRAEPERVDAVPGRPLPAGVEGHDPHTWTAGAS